MKQTDEQKAAKKKISELMGKLSTKQILLLGISIIGGILYPLPEDKRPGVLLDICTEINNGVATLKR